MQFSIIVLSMNHINFTLRLLHSLNVTQGDFETILIDNGSEPDVISALKRIESSRLGRDLRLRCTFNTTNIGIASGRNQGVRQSTGRILVFLDNDTEIIHSDWLIQIAKVYQDNTKLGTVGGVLLNPDRTIQFAGGSVNSRAHVTFRTTLASGMPTTHTMFSLGACFSTPKYCWEKIGGFDNRYDPMDFEDIDYCLRATAMNLPSYICQSCILIHYAHTTTKSEPGDFSRLQHYIRSGSRFLKRWRVSLEKDSDIHSNKEQIIGHQ